tara:strand:+ start:140641 stop:141768 length:1128 start_codon:yes stop_codon:yes gene_type:complete
MTFSILGRFKIALILTLVFSCDNKNSDIPIQFSKEQFATLVEILSENGGNFDSDNLVSNEAGYLHISSFLKKFAVKNEVYIGVGPDQNFTYISQLKPRYAFILDIRRDNLIEHLIYKAIFDLSETRALFLSLLFSKPLSDGLLDKANPSIIELVEYFDKTQNNEDLYKTNLKKITDKISTYGISLKDRDYSRIANFYQQFFQKNLNLKWEYRSDGDRGIPFITYRSFLLGKDLEGNLGNFLNSNEDYWFIRDMQARNAIIPIIGDFAGEHALQAIGQYVRKRGDLVSVFYLSNVEYYLYPDKKFDQFARNLRSLPINGQSLIIRAFVNLRNQEHPKQKSQHLMTTLIQYVRSFNQLYAEGTYQSYYDLGTKNYIH